MSIENKFIANEESKEGDDSTVQDRGSTGAERGIFPPLKKIKNNSRSGQNLVLKIDWTGGIFWIGANFSTK